MRVFACLVIVFVALALAEDIAAPVAPPVSMDICKYVINGRNLTLSETKQPTETCLAIGHALRYNMLVRVYTGISRLASSLARFGVPNPNATLPCNVNIVDQALALPLADSETECSYWQRHVSFLAEESVLEQLDILGRAMHLSDDAEPEGPRQTAALTPKAPCAFGPYGLTLAHWLKTDCDLARALYARCLTQHKEGNTPEDVFYCFTQAIARTEGLSE